MANEIPKRLLDIKVADLLDQHFSATNPGHGTCGRIKNLLRWHEPPIETVGDLVKFSNRELARFTNIGKKTIAEIESILNKLEIQLAYRKGCSAVYLGAPEPQNPFYSLKLHEVLEVDQYTQVMRVSGGWIYKFLAADHYIFVPEHGGTTCV